MCTRMRSNKNEIDSERHTGDLFLFVHFCVYQCKAGAYQTGDSNALMTVCKSVALQIGTVMGCADCQEGGKAFCGLESMEEPTVWVPLSGCCREVRAKGDMVRQHESRDKKVVPAGAKHSW